MDVEDDKPDSVVLPSDEDASDELEISDDVLISVLEDSLLLLVEPSELDEDETSVESSDVEEPLEELSSDDDSVDSTELPVEDRIEDRSDDNVDSTVDENDSVVVSDASVPPLVPVDPSVVTSSSSIGGSLSPSMIFSTSFSVVVS